MSKLTALSRHEFLVRERGLLRAMGRGAGGKAQARIGRLPVARQPVEAKSDDQSSGTPGPQATLHTA